MFFLLAGQPKSSQILNTLKFPLPMPSGCLIAQCMVVYGICFQICLPSNQPFNLSWELAAKPRNQDTKTICGADTTNITHHIQGEMKSIKVNWQVNHFWGCSVRLHRDLVTPSCCLADLSDISRAGYVFWQLVLERFIPTVDLHERGPLLLILGLLKETSFK